MILTSGHAQGDELEESSINESKAESKFGDQSTHNLLIKNIHNPKMNSSVAGSQR